MRSISKLIERFMSRNTIITATKGGVAVNGGNSGLIIVNDNDSIKTAVAEVLVSYGDSRNHGIAGELQNEIGRQIDHYRNKMNDGRVKEALELYSELLIHQAKNLTSHSIFRIKANIAICKHLLGEVDDASRILLEACTYAPEDDKSIAFKVFAYLMVGDTEKALAYGMSELERNPANEALAAFILQAARIDSQFRVDYEDPFERFPTELKKAKSVRLAHIHFLAAKEADGWQELAAEYLIEDPEELLAKSLVAQGILQHFVNERQTPNGFKFTADDVSRLKVASKHLEDYWSDLRQSDRFANGWDLQVIHSLIITYKLSNNLEALRTLCEFAVSELASDQGLIDATAKCLLDLNEPELCLSAIEKIESAEEARKLKFLLLVAQKDWAALAKIQDYSLARFEGAFLTQASVVVYIARAHKGDSRGKADLEQLLQRDRLDSRARLLLYDYSCACGLNSIAELAFSYGKNFFDQPDVIELHHYIKLARSLMKWKEIILRLADLSDLFDSYELTQTLAIAYLNEYPLRAEAVEFFERLSTDPRGFELLLGIFYFKRRAFEKVPNLVEQYYNFGGRDIYGLLALIDIAKIQNNIDSLKEILSDYEPSRYDGSPEQWMHVARGLIDIGDSKRGVDLAYKTYADSPNLAKVALGYFHAFLTANKDTLLDDSIAVGAGCYIKLVASDGTVIERTVSETIEDELVLSPEAIDPYVAKLVGQRVGYEYEQEKLHGSITWKLAEVKHKYLDAFHRVCSTYETQFPNEGGLWSLKVEEGNVQPLLDFIRKQAERDQNFIATIAANSIPISIAGGIWRKNVFQVTDLMRSANNQIETCAGTFEERMETAAIVSRHKGGSIVLDAYTSWVAAELNLLEVLNNYFKRVIIVQDSVDLMRGLLIENDSRTGSGFNIGWVAGEFVKTEYTEAEIANISERFSRNIRAIESGCEIVHFDFSSNTDDLTETLLEISPEAIAPYFLAKEQNALFVSEDGYSRGFAKNAYGLADSAWLQAIVNELTRENMLTSDHYVDAVLGLCRYRHSTVAISSHVIESVFERDSTHDLREFKLISKYIGGPTAERNSHMDLVMKFILKHWLFEYNPTYNQLIENMLDVSHGDAFPTAKVKKATSMLLEQVLLMPNGRSLLIEIRNYPILRLPQFINDWWKGHFYK